MDQPPPPKEKEPGRVVDVEKTVAGGRILAALEEVERAQRDLNRASEELYGVAGFGPEWTKLGKLSDQVHAHWKKIKRKYEKGRFGRLDLVDRPDEEGRRNMGKSPSRPQL